MQKRIPREVSTSRGRCYDCYEAALPDRGEQYGFYFVGEPSGPVDTVDRFDRMFGILFYHGCSATSIFMDLEQYMKFEEQTGHLSRRAPLLRLLKKRLQKKDASALCIIRQADKRNAKSTALRLAALLI